MRQYVMRCKTLATLGPRSSRQTSFKMVLHAMVDELTSPGQTSLVRKAVARNLQDAFKTAFVTLAVVLSQDVD